MKTLLTVFTAICLFHTVSVASELQTNKTSYRCINDLIEEYGQKSLKEILSNPDVVEFYDCTQRCAFRTKNPNEFVLLQRWVEVPFCNDRRDLPCAPGQIAMTLVHLDQLKLPANMSSNGSLVAKKRDHESTWYYKTTLNSQKNHLTVQRGLSTIEVLFFGYYQDRSEYSCTPYSVPQLKAITDQISRQ